MILSFDYSKFTQIIEIFRNLIWSLPGCPPKNARFTLSICKKISIFYLIRDISVSDFQKDCVPLSLVINLHELEKW